MGTGTDFLIFLASSSNYYFLANFFATFYVSSSLFVSIGGESCIFIKHLQHALFMFYNNCHGPAANIWKIEENFAFHFSVPNENPSGAASSFAATRNFYNNFSICVWPSWQINSSAQWSVYCAGKTFFFLVAMLSSRRGQEKSGYTQGNTRVYILFFQQSSG